MTWLHTQVAGLQRIDGVEPHVVCEHIENIDQFPVLRLHCLDDANWRRQVYRVLRTLRFRRYLAFQVRTAADHHAAVLHSHFGHVGWANSAAARQLNIPHVVTFYGLDVNKLPQSQPVWIKRYRALFESVAAVLCEGPHMAGCIERLGCAPEKVHVQRLGITLANFPFSPRQWNPGSPLRVLIAASFREKKGIPCAIEALGKVARDIPLEVTVIGDAGQDPASRLEKRRIMAAVGKTGLADRITFLGYQPHTELIRQAYLHHVFLHPSRTAADGDTEGGAPVSIIEMVATGMPVISTRHCDIPDVIGPQGAALLADEGDADGVARAMLALAANSQNWSAMLADLRARIERRHDADVQVKALAAHYDRLAGDRSEP
jgi:colanic acid/amylovoran biosynthesis glycosyltransferase